MVVKWYETGRLLFVDIVFCRDLTVFGCCEARGILVIEIFYLFISVVIWFTRFHSDANKFATFWICGYKNFNFTEQNVSCNLVHLCFRFLLFVEGTMFSKLLCVYIYIYDDSTCMVEIKILSVLWFGLLNILFDL